jgi:CMP-N-acetylneuraminic acid synthetase
MNAESTLKTLIALLPMKGHSERVPNKNLRDFCGRPLYHRMTESLLSSRYVTEVAINTDSQAIAADARKHFERIRIIERPDAIRGDFVSMNTIIAHDLSVLRGEHFLQTHSTNPLLTTGTVDRAIEAYFESLDRYDSLFSVTRLQTRLYWNDGSPINHNPAELLRTQDLPPVFEENSNLYVFSRSSFSRAGQKRIGKTPLMFEMDRLEAVDIDEEADFRVAEALFSLRHDGKNG